MRSASCLNRSIFGFPPVLSSPGSARARSSLLVALEALGFVRCIAAKAGHGRKRRAMSYGVRVWVLALCGMLACNRFDRVCVQVLSQIRHLHGQVYEGRRLCLKARVDTEFVRGGLLVFITIVMKFCRCGQTRWWCQNGEKRGDSHLLVPHLHRV